MTRPLRVLHLHSGNLYGGIETLLVALARYREQCAAMEQEFALCFDARLARELRGTGAAVAVLGGAKLSRPWTLRRVRGMLGKAIAERQYDVVICHSAWSRAVFGPALRGSHAHLVLWEHSASTKTHWLERWASRIQPDLTLANSEFTRAVLAEREPGLAIEVLYAPVAPSSPDPAQRDSLRAALGTTPDTTVILQVSRMEPWKGQLVHLQALGQLRELEHWVCWQVGGPQRAREQRYLADLEAHAERLGIAGRVEFLGQRGDTAALYGAADVFCQPNTGPEPFGIVFVEALYAGLPVVTSNFGGGAEIIDSSCGLLVPPNDPSALAAALRTLVTDHELRRRLGAAGPERARALCEPVSQVSRLHEILADRFGSL
ncbi:MAG: glycosyltransferase family 4 protein [Gemmatimonadales bacterium]